MSRAEEFANSRSAHIAEISDSKSESHDDLWTSVSKDGEPQAIARLQGGYETPKNWDYEAFPNGQAQGELFNVRTPKLAGWYKGQGATPQDAAAALGLALEESKKRYGRLPEPDSMLSPDSAKTVARLTGKKVEPTYLEETSKSEREDEGERSTYHIGRQVLKANIFGDEKARKYKPEEITAGLGTISGLLRGKQFNGEKPAANTPAKNSLKSPVEQPTLPGL